MAKYEYLELATGERGKRHMSKKIKYSEGEIGNFKIVKDFLPEPAELVMKEKNVRVTINLRESSVNFF